MASVRVAVRVRPINQRETELESKCIIHMEDKKTTIENKTIAQSVTQGEGIKDVGKSFTYDHSYCSMDKEDHSYASQQQVFNDLGVDVINSAYEGYNACVFAYGQTGSGKTYTMMGTHDDVGLIPRICEGLFAREIDKSMTYRTEVSYLEIYNEKVRDLLKMNTTKGKPQNTLRVREHPKEGPYVQDLSKHIVADYVDIKELMDKGNAVRTTASTNMNDTSSRSHAIFTIVFTQAKFSKDTPSETHSKIHLVDLAGSERANATGATGQRLKEGSSINTSLVTLGNVISSLADLSEKGTARKSKFIPYRNSVLTWLLKDSLGGNAKTIMIAAISPAECNYAETLSTLRYANRAKNIINKPTVNEDRNVKLIRDLRDEIQRLKTLLGGNLDQGIAPKVQEKLHENEARVKVLTEEWTGKWKEIAHILNEEKTLALRKEGLGVVLDSQLPHLIGLDDDILSTGIMLYHLKEGTTLVGTKEATEAQQIVLQGPSVEEEHCIIEHIDGQVTLIPCDDALCTVNGTAVDDPIMLTQGTVILLGQTNMFRFNHPEQAAKMREMKDSELNLCNLSRTMGQSVTDLAKSTENLALLTSGWDMEQRHIEQLEALEKKREQIEELEEQHRQSESSRIAEQEVQERQIQEKRKQLDGMQTELDESRREVKEIEMVLKKESAKLKRQSLDIEMKYAEYQKEKIQFEEQKKKEMSFTEKDAEKTDSESFTEDDYDKLKVELQKEKEKLVKEEKRIAEEILVKQEELKREKDELKRSYEEKESMLMLQQKELVKKKDDLEEKIHQAEKDMLDKEHEIAHLKEVVLRAITDECSHLEDIRSDQSLYHQYAEDLHESTRKTLQPAWQKLQEAQRILKKKESEFYEEYLKMKTNISEDKDLVVSQIEKDKEQLKADRIYLEECEAKFSQLDTDEDQLDKEQIALAVEKERIQEESDEILIREDDAICKEQKSLEMLQANRDEQIEELKIDRERIQDIQQSFMDRVQKQLQKSEDNAIAKEHQISELERQLSEFHSQEDTEQEAIELEKHQIEQEQRILLETVRNKDEEYNKYTEQLKNKQLETKLYADTLKEQLHEKTCRLTALEQQYQISVHNSDELKQCWQDLLSYRHEPRHEAQDQASDGRGKKDQSSDQQESLLYRIQELKSLEMQVEVCEADLEKQREWYEVARQLELDNIDQEKCQLQEMEEQERINALVDQEVKRTLFKERVKREKQRLVERENDRQERHQELSKIKQAHNREIAKLRQKYEANNTHVNMPTKANPYASPMIRDISPAVAVKNSRSSHVRDGGQVSSYNTSQKITVTIPCYMHRGSGFDSYVEYEIKLSAGGDVWSVFRRYSKFRELHKEIKSKFTQVEGLAFPPKKWIGNQSEHNISERRKLLEDYLVSLVEVLQGNRACILHPTNAKLYSKQILHQLHPFFKRGVFEMNKYGTA